MDANTVPTAEPVAGIARLETCHLALGILPLCPQPLFVWSVHLQISELVGRLKGQTSMKLSHQIRFLKRSRIRVELT
jgi:hypothetical protein